MKAFELLEEWPVPTIAAAVIDPRGDVRTHGPVQRRFALASVTKLLTAAAVHLAVEEGTIALNDSADGNNVTVSDLLAHASGLSPDGKQLDDPGRRRIYSNAGYERLARIVTDAAAMPFTDYLTEGIFGALSMSSTELIGSPAHGAESTIEDLVRFVRGLPELLAPSTIDDMVTPYLPELIGVLPGYGRQTPNSWGLGPEIRSEKTPHWTGSRNSPATWGHFGAAGTYLWVDPDVQISMVVLTDKAFGDWAIERWPVLNDSVLAELLD